MTLFLAGFFHLIVILGISFAPPSADSGGVPTLEVLLVNNSLPDTSKNERADYLAERTQQGSGNSPDGKTRRPSAGSGAETSRAIPRAAPTCRHTMGRTGGDGEVLSGRGGSTQILRRVGRCRRRAGHAPA